MLSGDSSGADEFAAVTAPLPSRLGRIGWIAAGVMALVAAGASWMAWRATRPSELKPLVRLDVDLGSDVSLGSTAGAGADAILSPDGTRLVYVSKTRLFTRRLDQPKAIELAGTEGSYAPFFSPDGQWVAFFAPGKLMKISVAGGAAVALCDANNARGGSWGEDGTIIAALNPTNVLSRVPSAGGTPTPVTELALGEITHRWPQILPGGKAVLFTTHTATSGFDAANIEVMSLGDRHRKTIQRGGTFGRYLPSGHILYVNAGTLFAAPFDLDNLVLRGTPTPMLEQVTYNQGSGSSQLDFSGAPYGTGTLVYRSGGSAFALTVQWLDGTGKTLPLLAKPGLYLYPRLSPDGQRLALTTTEGSNPDIWIYEWQRDTMTRLTFGGGSNDVPLWSPDGRYRFLRGAAVEIQANFSPDGRFVAYASNDSGRCEVQVRTFPLSDRKWTVSTNGGYEPRWRGDGREIYYLSEDRKLMAVSVDAGPLFGVPKALFQTRASGANPLRTNYVPSRDGRRFLVNTQSGDAATTPITIVLNWTTGLKK